MKFIADLHVHSKFSRATSHHLDLEHLFAAANIKGVTVVATGDFTHPAWFSEIKEKLVSSGNGLFKLNERYSEEAEKDIPPSCNGDVHFILESEISNIYRKAGKTRKNHNLIFFPDLETAEKLNKKLDKIGNIRSDGRPILGLDTRNLLEIVLEISDRAFLIPAHIWTPWFSLLGSKSGFDSLRDCFEDLTKYLFAVETGLSSDPEMNWRVSSLDPFTLVSNSDAHSPAKLAREANIFDTELSFDGIRNALSNQHNGGFLGTFEFYPQEGKYHLDGHRKCNIRFRPEESILHQGICPVCNKPLTLGVLHRVEELADRKEGERPEKIHPFYRMLPLTDILAQVLETGPASKTVLEHYRTLVRKLGPELTILYDVPVEGFNALKIPLLGEAIRRMRESEIDILPGFDGEFGTLHIFSARERKEILGQNPLFAGEGVEKIQPSHSKKIGASLTPDRERPEKKPKPSEPEKEIRTGEPTPQQEAVVCHEGGSLMIVAGPGTGKTHTITRRIAHLIENKGVSPDEILAITFTNKAADEMRERLQLLLSAALGLPRVATFHSFCLGIIKEVEIGSSCPRLIRVIDDLERKSLVSEAIRLWVAEGHKAKITAETASEWVAAAKQRSLLPKDDLTDIVLPGEMESFSHIYKIYETLLSIQYLMDYEDLINRVNELLMNHPEIRKGYQDRYPVIFVDEYQDINYGQYRLIRLLYPEDRNNRELCVIGDPHQSIYGFRGSDVRYFNNFVIDYPNAMVYRLDENFRSNQTILSASSQIMKNHQEHPFLSPLSGRRRGSHPIAVLEHRSEKEEARRIAQRIEKMAGGVGYFSIDSGRVDGTDAENPIGFSDIAVLYRIGRQGPIIAGELEKAGIPFQIASKGSIPKRVTELVSLFKIMENMGSFVDLERTKGVLNTGIGKKGMAAFTGWCFRNGFGMFDAFERLNRFPVEGMRRNEQLQFVSLVNKISQTRERMTSFSSEEKLSFLMKQFFPENGFNEDATSDTALSTLLDHAGRYGADAAEFIASIALKSDPDLYDARAEKVSLMTMHGAKGLEFPVVFIAGCENGLIPYHRTENQRIDMDEERRLFYVAVTRAKDRLLLSWAKNRTIYGIRHAREISPFIMEMEQDLKELHSAENKPLRKNRSTQLQLF
ncbi:MAG: UvrD-helicase domain-containing protein [Pseudomonadota bacterium]